MASAHVFAWNKLTDSLDIACNQSDPVISCNYRSLDGNQNNEIRAKTKTTSLEIVDLKKYSQNKISLALLFVVDTSDPARQNVIEKNKQHIKSLISALEPGYKVGLASFDKTLQIKSPVGTSSFLLVKSLDTLKAEGKTTELYRNLIKAIKHLENTEADRKAIILLSDGQAEDKAYFHSDVVRAARGASVIINSIGYPRSVSLSVALQTLRRLSEETGGKYVETKSDYNLPENYLQDPFSNITNGGTFNIRLNEQFNQKPSKTISLEFSDSTGKKIINLPVDLSRFTQKESGQVTVKTDTSDTTNKTIPLSKNNETPPVQIITRQVETQPINLWLWYGLPAAFIVIIILILITLFLLWHRPASNKKSSGTEYRPYAYLIAQDNRETRYPITRSIWRIGRGKDNELRLDDTSISRRHAEIHRNNNGTFDILDMNSMNGVYINNEKVGKAELHEGDMLEIGDIYLKFTQLASDYSLEESTVMQKTKTPSVTH